MAEAWGGVPEQGRRRDFLVATDIHLRPRFRFSFWEPMNESTNTTDTINTTDTMNAMNAMNAESSMQSCRGGCPCVNPRNLRILSDVCLGLGFASILLSVFTWFFRGKADPAHGERSGIFIGLWVPSFFMLAHRLARKAEQMPQRAEPLPGSQPK
jgi:hypothetical protein